MSRAMLGLSVIVSACVLASASARAGVSITIDERVEPLTFTATGFDPVYSSVLGIDAETVDFTGQWVTTDAGFLGAGETRKMAFVFFGVYDIDISDYLLVTFTGLSPTAEDPNTIQVDISFVSMLDVVKKGKKLKLPKFVNSLEENGELQDLVALFPTPIDAGGATLTHAWPSDFGLVVGSDISAAPEPSMLPTACLGLLAAITAVRRRRASA